MCCSTSHVLFLHVAEPPRIIAHPNDLKDAVRGKPAKFTIQATGTEPLTYQWEWKPAEEEGGGVEWQPCPTEWCDVAVILIPMQKSGEGSYRCVVSNCAGSETSEPAKVSYIVLISEGHLMCMKYASCARQIHADGKCCIMVYKFS